MIKYETDLRAAFKEVDSAWDKLEAALKEVDAALEERLDSLIPLELLNEELKGILKSIIENDGMMTQGQRDAVNRYFGWESARECVTPTSATNIGNKKGTLK